MRCAKLAKDRGIGGPLLGPSAYFMKSPPVQYHDDEARRMVEEFAAGLSSPDPPQGLTLRQDGVCQRILPLSGTAYSAAYQSGAELPTNVAHYGPDIPTEAELRLLGDLRGKKVLELGCGGAQCSIAFAKQGATAIGVDFSAAQLAFARRLCEREEVRVELRQGDLADLAFLRADSIDLVFSAYAFGYVEDLNRVFRQVHRVLKVGAPAGVQPLPSGLRPDRRRRRSAAARPAVILRPVADRLRLAAASLHRVPPHPLGDLHGPGPGQLPGRPHPRAAAAARTGTGPSTGERRLSMVPRTLIIRARKEGN